MGISADYALSFWFVFLVLGSLLSWFKYKNLREQHPGFMVLLIALRSLSLALIILVLFNLSYESEYTQLQKTTIAVLLDNSESVGIDKNEYKGAVSYQKALSSALGFDTTLTRLSYFSFHREVGSIRSLEALDYTGQDTDLDMAFRTVLNQQKDPDAIILFSDGIFTLGNDPSSTVASSGIPVYVIALGDTSSVRDIIISKVDVPEKAYKKSPVQLSVTIDQEGYPGSEVDVRLKKGDRIIDRKTLRFSASKSQHEVTFVLEPTESGLQSYEVQIPVQTQEWNSRNNSYRFSLNVVDELMKVLHLAFEIHPDVRALRSMLSESADIQLYPYTWIGGNRFLEGNLPNMIDSLDVIVIQGYSPRGVPPMIAEYVQNLFEKKPFLWLPGPATNFSLLNDQVGANLPFTLNGFDRHYPAGIKLEASQRSHPILNELSAPDALKSPLIFSPIRSLSKRANSTQLLLASYLGSDIEAPLLLIQTVGNQRRAAFMGFGFYEWTLSTDATVSVFVGEVMRNTVAWLSAPSVSELLSISSPKRQFSADEQVRFNAFLKNESGQFDSNAKVDALITNVTENSTKNFTLQNAGFGQYTLDAGKMNSGNYRYRFVASKDGKLIDQAEGEFLVVNSNSELINTKRNDGLLRYIATINKGTFVTYDEAGVIAEQLKSSKLLKPKETQAYFTFSLRQEPWWLFILLLLLTFEWGIRKYLGLS